MMTRLVFGTIGAIIGAVIGAIAWAAISSATGFQIGYVAVGVGFLAGYGMRTLGGGRDRADGVIAAIVALLGCMLGNVLAALSRISQHLHLTVTDVTMRVMLRPHLAVDILKETFQVMDLLFYALAVYAAYRAAMRPAMPMRTTVAAQSPAERAPALSTDPAPPVTTPVPPNTPPAV